MSAPRRQRHLWSPAYRKPLRTDRVCFKCEIVRVTRHEPGVLPWVEFEVKGVRVDTKGRTPECRRAEH
jgi:hypothetical protein